MLESQIKYVSQNEVEKRKEIEPLVKDEKSKSVLKILIHGIENAIVNHYRNKFDELKKEGRWDEYVKHQCYNVCGLWLPKIAKIANNLTIVGNEEYIPQIGKTGFITISNHKYTLDPFYITCALKVGNAARKVRWISKYDNSKGIIGVIAEPIEVIFLSKEKKSKDDKNWSEDRHWTKKAKEQTFNALLNKNEGVCMCPEGTRVKDEKLGRFRSGAADILFMVNYEKIVQSLEKNIQYKPIPYVPIAIIGKPIPFFGGDVELRVSKPVILRKEAVEQYYNSDDNIRYKMRRELADDMHEQIKALLENRSVPKSGYEK